MTPKKITNFTPCPDMIIRELGPYAGVIFGMIYRYSQKYGYCTAAQETIAKKLNMNRSTINKHLQALINHDPPFIEDLDVGLCNKPHRYRPVENFDFYPGFTVGDTDSAVGDADSKDGSTVGDTNTAVGDTDSAVGETDTGVGDSNSIKECIKVFKKEIDDKGASDPLTQKAQRAWEAVLSQLQRDMAKATFDTWVKDSVCVSFEDGTFIIGTGNSYSRDWLDSRLTSTVSGLLAGMMDQSVEVRFVVWQINGKTERS